MSVSLPHRSGRVVGAALLGLSLAASTPFISLAAPAPAQQAGANPTVDERYIDLMVPHQQAAVQMAEIALKRGQHAQIKALARSMLAASTRAIGEMKGWRKSWYGSAATPSLNGEQMMVVLPGMHLRDLSDMMNMMNDIRALKRARPFDRAFIDAMVRHHGLAVRASDL